MAQIAGLITNYQQAKTAYESLNALMTAEVERPEDITFVRRPAFTGAIELKNLQFAYPEMPAAILNDVSINISPGEHVGLIGRVGSGKTTIAKLLLGLYRPVQGSITVDEIDINQIDPADLRHGIAYLSQEIELMRGTIRDNIVLKEPQADDDTVLEAARVAGVDLFVNALPRGFDSPLGEHGQGLSGGQRQCLALARTVLLGEPIIILDEPTNSMDNTTESVIRERLYEYTRDKTLVLITHKAPMLELVERLVVMEEGRVILDGPKEEVIAKLQSSSELSRGAAG